MKNLLLLIFVILILGNAKSQTSVPGGYVYGTWTLSGSPYLVFGSIKVPNDSTLSIEPGVIVNFQGHYKFLVEGTLIAEGAVNDSIYFTSDDTITGWYGIRFDNILATNDSSKFSYCNIQWGKATGNGNDAQGGAFLFNNFSKVIVENCLIKNCSTLYPTGSAIYGLDSSPIINNNRIYNCTGGISIYNSQAIISNNDVSFNDGIAISVGGGTNGPITIFNNKITYNGSGGMYANKALITYNTISYNTITANQTAGIYVESGGLFDGTIISHNIISHNTRPFNNTGYNAGIMCYNCNSTITDNIISNNTSSTAGGIFVAGGLNSSPTIINNVIINNSTSGNGGGINLGGGGSPIVKNNTIANNSANKGGGMYFEASSSTPIYNCILYGNTANSSGDQVYISDEPSDPDFYNCTIEGGNINFELNGNFYSGTYSNCITSNPLFVNPSNNSGTSSNGLAADWSLQLSSPCIDAGYPTGTYPATDVAGNPRIYGSVIDIGAYESQTPLSLFENTPHNSFEIYPNPTSNQLSIDTELTINDIVIVDITGKVIKTFKENTNIINVSDLSNGIYFIKLIADKKTITQKFIKQ